MTRIDARGMRCPWPALRLARALRDSPRGPIEILADDPAAEAELTQLATARGLSLHIGGSPENRRFRVIP